MVHRSHIHGRSGSVVHALSAIDIALSEIAGKRVGAPICTLPGGQPRELTAYASLLRYAEPALVPPAIARARELEPLKLAWLEEPVWPPDDHGGLARVRASASTPIAAGDKVSSLHALNTMPSAGAIDSCQRSVIKFGSITAVAEAVVIGA